MLDDSNPTREPNGLERGAPRMPGASSCGCGGSSSGCGCGSCSGTGKPSPRSEGRQPAGLVIPLISRRTYDFSNVAATGVLELPLIRAQPVVGYADAILQLRVYSATVPGLSSVELRAQAISPSCDDPGTDFLGMELGSITLDSSTTAPSLHSISLGSDFGSHIQFVLLATRDSGTFTVELGADLVVREAGVEPALYRRWTNHAYTPGVATIRFVPFASNVSGGPLADGTPSLRMVAERDGWLERAIVYVTTAPTSTDVGLYLNNSATSSMTVSQAMSDHSAVVFDFGPAARFSRGDLLSIGLVHGAVPGSVNVDCEWVYRRGT